MPCETSKLWIEADVWAPLPSQYRILSFFKLAVFILRFMLPSNSKYFRPGPAVFSVNTTLKVAVCFFPTFCSLIIIIYFLFSHFRHSPADWRADFFRQVRNQNLAGQKH